MSATQLADLDEDTHPYTELCAVLDRAARANRQPRYQPATLILTAVHGTTNLADPARRGLARATRERIAHVVPRQNGTASEGVRRLAAALITQWALQRALTHPALDTFSDLHGAIRGIIVNTTPNPNRHVDLVRACGRLQRAVHTHKHDLRTARLDSLLTTLCAYSRAGVEQVDTSLVIRHAKTIYRTDRGRGLTPALQTVVGFHTLPLEHTPTRTTEAVPPPARPATAAAR
ncbi:hypothetical protein [Kitasatospora sp. NPDC059327]|uniref:hypothetical protein n=1 Tax=Kitasatospora sp. NPDC059327 TaxID=3346803 RepID=UPI0036CECC6F